MNKDLFSIFNRATSKAFERVGKSMGQEPNQDLQIYNSLNPQHFSKLMKTYGEQNVLDYIRHMEMKRIQGGGK